MTQINMIFADFFNIYIFDYQTNKKISVHLLNPCHLCAN